MKRFRVENTSRTHSEYFETEEECIEYIKKYICKTCLDEYKNGGFYILIGDQHYWCECEGVLDTQCGLHWCIEEV